MESINDVIGQWHEDLDTTATLPEYLGFTEEEFSQWVKDNKVPERLSHVYYK